MAKIETKLFKLFDAQRFFQNKELRIIIQDSLDRFENKTQPSLIERYLFMSDNRINDDALGAIAGGKAEGFVVIGTARVLTNDLRIRYAPNTDCQILGTTSAPAMYDVLEITQNEGYIWYRIGLHKWIANNGSWVRFEAN